MSKSDLIRHQTQSACASPPVDRSCSAEFEVSGYGLLSGTSERNVTSGFRLCTFSAHLLRGSSTLLWFKHRSGSQEVWIYSWPCAVTLGKSGYPFWAPAHPVLYLCLDKHIAKCFYCGHYPSLLRASLPSRQWEWQGRSRRKFGVFSRLSQ